MNVECAAVIVLNKSDQTVFLRHNEEIQNQTDVYPDFGTREANYLGCVSQSSHQRRIFHNYLNHTPGLRELRSLLYTSSKHVQMCGLS